MDIQKKVSEEEVEAIKGKMVAPLKAIWDAVLCPVCYE